MFTDIDLSDEKEVSNDNNAPKSPDESKKEKSFFYNHVIKPFKKNPMTCASIVLIFLSTLLLFVLLVGGRTRSVYLSKFVFKDPIKLITKKNELTFTLYGHCVDDQCTQPNMLNDFDKMPSSSEITNNDSTGSNGSTSSRKVKRIDVGGIANGATKSAGNAVNNAGQTATNAGQSVGNTVNNAGQSAGNAVNNAGQSAGNAVNDAGQAAGNVTQKAGDIAQDAGQKVVDAANDVIKEATGLLNSLVQAFENFKPKHPTANFSGFISIPYLIALLSNICSLILLYFHFPTPATLFLLASTILNGLALFFDLLVFVWVFDLISVIPGIGSQYTGPGIHLAAWSAAFLGIASIMLGGRLYYKICCGGFSRDAYKAVKKQMSKGIKKLRKPKVNEEEEQKQLQDKV
ncbi:2126_t:CDS:2 [Ambispora leptoticha]|uniref:2126_t:CDS:1 n=1 Tax=Ambispora leptoticha TaxID=144679 RepID=A0A9N8YYY7_9GLOM|nr:2126_t:CDS:2 [Ambispora leptoticha]